MNKSEYTKKVRLMLGLNQAEMAKRLGYSSQVSISRIESGERQMNNQALAHLDTIVKYEVPIRNAMPLGRGALDYPATKEEAEERFKPHVEVKEGVYLEDSISANHHFRTAWFVHRVMNKTVHVHERTTDYKRGNSPLDSNDTEVSSQTFYRMKKHSFLKYLNHVKAEYRETNK